ncbi:tetratricopeptide repeat protein [Sporosarcina highlanderae]|uniref:Tetratricopeptide repeat protein n=1 Tax=Sporosarcina highlanderae TaxID=3035916 RepID=A0ABT8JPU5_9BACL|nr:tetratricopeptide repeat protein [Sporosarcina highlanderae]MDN4607163.1 tetratricopeptide repeat protein [Sporosarcina highlanderae]
MRKRNRYGRLLKKENVVMFPGALESLIEKGLDAVEDTNYPEAVEAFEQVYRFDPDNPRFLAPYAVALYETKNFEEAKEIASKLLYSGTTEYLDAMELYLAISIQLQHYEEVEMTIEALLDEEIVPPEMEKKFNYLRDLNKRLSHRYVSEHDEPKVANEIFTVEEFLDKSITEQQEMIAALAYRKSDKSVMELFHDIVEKEGLHPIVITYILVLLFESGYKQEVTITKFGNTKTVIPYDMDPPGYHDRYKEVVNLICEIAEKDPSRMQMALDAAKRYSIIAYPFNWDGYSTAEVATAYTQYIESMFQGEPMLDTELNSLIKKIDEQTDR